MKISCTLVIEYDDAKKANKILQSIQVDDFDFVKSNVKENKLEAIIDASSVNSILHTLDDYLSCISIAEKIVNKN
jgi:hypothetical protein